MSSKLAAFLKATMLSLCLMMAAVEGAAAACPSDSPCESRFVYRIQTWPGFRYDANGVDLLSLREANAANSDAFADVIKGYGKGQALALRFKMTRIAIAPNGYCNCNFEFKGKACMPPIDASTLLQCNRTCLTSGKACFVSGEDKKDKGSWYAFPALTEMTSAKKWQKNAYEYSAKVGDWSSDAPRIIRATCISSALQANPNAGIDSFFDDATKCPVVDMKTIDAETIPRK